MVSLVAPVLVLAAEMASSEIWTCTYPGYLDPQHPVLVRFRREGEYLVESNFGLKYRILQDTQWGLVAAKSIAEPEPNHKKPTISAFVVAIDKHTGAFTRSKVSVPTDPNDRGVAGTCIAG